MAIRVREKNIKEIEERLANMDTALNKINYLESALRETGFSFEIKRFILKKLSNLYVDRKMFDKAARVVANKATVDIINKEKIESYLLAGEFYSKAGKIDDAEEMFVRAGREADNVQKEKIKLTMKNIYLISAKDLENKGKRLSAARFYERLVKMNLEEIEKQEIKEKLISTYRSFGLFRDAKLIEGL